MKKTGIFCAFLVIVSLAVSGDVGVHDGTEAILNLTISTKNSIKDLKRYSKWIIKNVKTRLNETRTIEYAEINRDLINPLANEIEAIARHNPNNYCLILAKKKLICPTIDAEAELVLCEKKELSFVQAALKDVPAYVAEGKLIVDRLYRIVAHCKVTNHYNSQYCLNGHLSEASAMVAIFKTGVQELQKTGELHRDVAFQEVAGCNEAATKIVRNAVKKIRDLAHSCTEELTYAYLVK